MTLQVLELMGYVGGFLGSWLGFSLLHVLFDLDCNLYKLVSTLKKLKTRSIS